MTNLDLEFDLDELISQVVFWQNRVKKYARKYYERGENKAEFDNAKQNLDIWIVRLLTNHFELYDGSLKLVLKETQPWAEDTDALLRIKQGVINTQIPVRELRKLSPDLTEKVKIKMNGIKIFKTNVESVWDAFPTGYSMITGNIFTSRLDKLVWEETKVVPDGATRLKEVGLHWRIRAWLTDLVRRQTGGRKANNNGVAFAEDRLDDYNVVIDDIIYRIRFFKAEVGYFRPTFVVVLEDTTYRESDTPEERKAKKAARLS